MGSDPRIDEGRRAARAVGTIAELRASSAWRIARAARLRAEADALDVEALLYAEEAGRRRYGVIARDGEGARSGPRATGAPGLARAPSPSCETDCHVIAERAGLAPGKGQ